LCETFSVFELTQDSIRPGWIRFKPTEHAIPHDRHVI